MSKWRSLYEVHPAADVFPMMSDAELAELGEDLKRNGGPYESIKLLKIGTPINIGKNAYAQTVILLDGRNRLEAMERAGIDLDSCAVRYQHVNTANPTKYIISQNCHRRHLTQLQKAELIWAATKAGAKDDPAWRKQLRAVAKERWKDDLRQVGEEAEDEEEPEDKPRQGGEVCKGGRGHINELKAQAVESAKGQGISKRTMERAIAKADGKAPAPAPVKVTLTPGIDAAREHYLSYVAELDPAARHAELKKITDATRRLHDR